MVREKFTRISTATTTQVRSGYGVLKKIIVMTQVADATISLIDNTSGSTVNIGVITCGAADVGDPFELEFNIPFSTGLRIITSGATDLLVIWQ